jgi:hypothetical protein
MNWVKAVQIRQKYLKLDGQSSIIQSEVWYAAIVPTSKKYKLKKNRN